MVSFIRLTIAQIALALYLFTPFVLAQDAAEDTTRTGLLILTHSRDSVAVLIDDDVSGVRLIGRGDTLEVPSGLRQIRVASRYDADMVSTRRIRPDALNVQVFHVGLGRPVSPAVYLRESVYPRLYWDANLAIATDPDATVFVDGEPVGGGLVFATLPPGRQRVEVLGPQNRKRSKTVEIDDLRLGYVEMYTRPARRRATALSLIPGASQAYRGRPLLGVAFAGATAAGVLGMRTTHGTLTDRRAEYLDARVRYRLANDESSALQLGNEMEAAYDRALDAQRTRNLVAGVTAAVFVLNLIESRRPPRDGYRTRYDLRTDVLPFQNRRGISLGVTRNF